MFEINNEFKNANVARTVRFTEALFEDLNKVATDNKISFNLVLLPQGILSHPLTLNHIVPQWGHLLYLLLLSELS